jgi:hypothetical protein
MAPAGHTQNRKLNLLLIYVTDKLCLKGKYLEEYMVLNMKMEENQNKVT